jgi:uncharacterized protein YqgC (DUF456 family)
MIMNEILLLGVALILMIIGWLGILIPIIPGIFVIWIGLGLYAWQTNFEVIGIPLFVVLSLMIVFAASTDLWLPLFGAKKSGAAKRALLYGRIGASVGSFIVPIIGTIIGLALGMLLGEYHKRRDWDTAVKVSWGGVKGWGIATAIQLVSGTLVIIIFIWQVVMGA